MIVGVLHLLGRNAGNLPGIILWHLTRGRCCKMFRVDCPIIAVTGTNGKTSVTNCIAQLFEQSGKKIIINKEGNNLDTGICSLLLRYCDGSGKVDADYLILETDESHVPVVYSQLKLETLVVLNFFRDQLDRNGEMETLIQKINGFCKTFEGNLILNGDDPNTARLGRANPDNKNVKYFRAERYAFATDKIFEASEGRFCPFCGEPLEYDFYQYSHIGRFICKKCGFGGYEPYITASNIDLEKPVFTAGGHEYSPKLNSIYNVYNMTAVAAAAKLYSIDYDGEVAKDITEGLKVNSDYSATIKISHGAILIITKDEINSADAAYEAAAVEEIGVEDAKSDNAPIVIAGDNDMNPGTGVGLALGALALSAAAVAVTKKRK